VNGSDIHLNCKIVVLNCKELKNIVQKIQKEEGKKGENKIQRTKKIDKYKE
jgi:hypothetical protein